MKKWMILCLAALIALPGTATTNVFAEDNTTNTTTSNESSSVTNDTYSSGTPVTHVESTNTGVSSNQTNSKPVITLIGDAQIQIKVGATFTDPGVTVQDDVYPDLKTANITYEYNGSPVTKVDTSLEGIFKIHYNVTNGDNVAADEVIRTVLVTSSKQYIDLSSVNLSNAYGMAYYGDYVYVAQRDQGISRVDLYTGKVTSVVKTPRSFMGVALNSSGDLFYTIDSDPNIYKVSHKDMLELPLSNTAFSESSTVFFSDKYNYIYGLAIDAKDNVYFSDYFTKAILKIPAGTNSAKVVIENFNTYFTSFSFDLSGNLYTAGDNEKVYRISSQDLNSIPLQSSSLVNLNPNSYISAYGIVFLPNGDSYIGSSGSMQKSPLQPTAPIIDLIGSSTITLSVGDTFVEPGVIITDSTYTDLVAKVSYTLNGTPVSSIDTNIAGTYTIYYNVTNPAKLSANEVIRTVIVKAAPTELSQVDLNRPFELAYFNGDMYYADYDRGIYKVSTTTFKTTRIAKSKNIVAVTMNQAGDIYYAKSGDSNVWLLKSKYLQDSESLPYSSSELEDYSTVVYTLPIQTLNPPIGSNENIQIEGFQNITQITGLALDQQQRLYIATVEDGYSSATSQIIRISGYNLNPEVVASYPTVIRGITISPLGNLYVNVGYSYLYKAKASLLQNLPVATENFEMMGKTNFAYGVAFLPDLTGYTSSVESNTLTKLGFLDKGETVPVTKVTLDKATLEFKKKGAAQTLKATVTPDNATDSTVLWISSNPSVATVADGVVSPIGKGTAIISAYSVTQKEIFASATVTVKDSDDKTSSSGGSQKITLDVDDGKGKTTIPATAVVNRTTQASGQKQDQITFSTDKVIEAISKLKEAAQQTVRLVVPDASDEVSQTDITLPLTAAKDLKNAAMNLEISTNDAKLSVASTSLNNITNDLYFHFVPLKTVAQQNAVANRAKQEEIVKQALGDGNISVVGRPMTIETNLQNQPVQLVMPIDNSVIPQDATAKQQWLNQLRIFIEHSDGDRELVQPSVVDYGNGQTGLQFTVTKFSTFTIVDMQKLSSSTTNNSTSDNNNVNTDTTAGVVKPAYIQGYPDQTFRPNNSITRAEMASLLYRLQASAPTASASGNGSYSDVSATFWAHQAIASMQSTGLMKGLTNGKFAPAQPITRAEMAAIVSRWQGLSGTGSSFANDINGHWAANDIKRVTTAGLMQGVSPSSFQPNQPLTRAQAVTILNKILEKTANLTASNKAWKDVPTSHWAYADIMEASNSYTLK
ncbi:S-layer homology domain-containing protein [Paenibacillus nicotianae]|uniref:S-layer homology domain-containing protein n=1 Tax=Paenibacillus nicotianae TaxID=1526551 RepID=A0ABW4UZ05_9BACL